MLAQRINEFIAHLSVADAYSENTMLAYRNDLMQFAHFARDCSQWSILEMSHVKRYIEQLKKKGYASSTVARKVAAIKTFLNYLQSDGIIQTDFAAQIDTPRVQRQVQPLLSPEQVEWLLEVPNKSRSPKNLRNKALLNLLYLTNLRITEVVELKVHHFDGKALYGIKLTEPMHKYLIDYLENGHPVLLRDNTADALFLNHRGSALTRQGVWLIIKECAQKAGLKVSVTPRMLRQSFDAHRREQSEKSSATQTS